MTDMLTPPPAAAAPAGTQEQPPRRDGAWISVLFTTIGAIIVAGALVVGLTTGFRVTGAEDVRLTAGVDGVDSVRVDFSTADVLIVFADVPDAELDMRTEGWTAAVDPSMTVENGELRVTDRRGGWNFLPNLGWWNHGAEVTVTLPASLEGRIDLRAEVSAGSTTAEGDFRAVDLDVSAGDITFTGDSTALDVDVSAGRAVVTTDGPTQIDLGVSAGEIIATITGRQPDTTTVDVSAGSVTLALPQGTYALSGSQSAGDRTIDVETASGADASLRVSVSAGDATVRYSD